MSKYNGPSIIYRFNANKFFEQNPDWVDDIWPFEIDGNIVTLLGQSIGQTECFLIDLKDCDIEEVVDNE